MVYDIHDWCDLVYLSAGDDYILTEGKKQTLICDVPAILCIHLKRFKQVFCVLCTSLK